MKYKRIDKYEFIGKIGQGGMSNIYKVRDVRLKKYWAVKEIDLEESDFANGKKQDILEKSLLGEMEILKHLEHPALPGIVDYFKIEKKMYIVIDYIEGENLKEKVEREGKQKEEEVLEWALQICDALEYLHHKKIIYRDLKPSNIMLNKENRVKLIDFGTARFYKKSMEEDTIYLGTKVYAAPEQFGGMGQTDARTDIYSLGMTLAYLLYGKSKIQQKCNQYVQKQSGQFYRIIEKCIMQNPDDRYQSCRELKEELVKYRAYKKKSHMKGKKRKRILIYSFFVFGIVGGVYYQISKQIELSGRTGIFKLSEQSKLNITSKIIQTSKPAETVSKEIQTSEPKEEASKEIQTSEPIEPSEVFQTIQPTEIPETLLSSKSSQTSKSKGSTKQTTLPIKTSKPDKQSEIKKSTKPTGDLDKKISPKVLTTVQPKKEKSEEKSNTKNEQLIIEIIE